MFKIEAFAPEHREAFRQLNEEWISTYFKLEQPDLDSLGNPEGYILAKGGHIFVATIDSKAVGVCAMIRRDDIGGYELAKMAVSPEARGQNIGYTLGQAVIAKARSMNARCVYLESNTILETAIRLYERLGFQRIVGPKTPYERCNIQMSIDLS